VCQACEEFPPAVSLCSLMKARHLQSVGAQVQAGTGGIQVETSEMFNDHPLKEVKHDLYTIEKNGSFGGGYSESGVVRREFLKSSEWSAQGSVKMEHQGKALYQASHIQSTKGDITLLTHGDMIFPGAKAIQEDIPTLSIKGTKIKKTVGSKEIGEIARVEAPLGQVKLESLEGTISGVKPHILSKDPRLKARAIELMEEQEFRKTLQRKQQTFVVGSTVDPGLTVVMSLALTVATGGVGVGAALATALEGAIGATAAAMVASGAEFMLSQAMTSTIVNQGHLSEVWKEITSKDALQQLAITMGTAGLGREFGLTMPGKNSDFLSHVKYHAQKALINTSVRAVIQGGKAQDLLKKAGMQALVDAFASYGAQRIGDAYAMGTKDMDYLTHKVLHGVLGGAAGALLGADPKKGAISGALSSMLAEVLAEAVIRPEEIGLEILDKAQKEGRFPGEQEYLAEVDRALRPLMDRIKLVTGVVALASGQDVEIALRTSGNALDENSKNMLGDAVTNVCKIATGKIRNQLRKNQAALKDKILKGGTKKAGAAPGQPGSNPNAAKLGTGQTGVPVKQGNPPEKKVASVGEKPLNNPRIVNPPKGESKIWKDLKPYKGEIKTNGETGKKQRFYTWDHEKNQIEVFDRNNNHLGAMDPVSGTIYEGSKLGRKLPKH
jgi:hypothetical protein